MPRHQETRGAVAALEPLKVHECGLDRGVLQPLHGQDLVPHRLHRQHQAAFHRPAVQDHRTGPAVPVLAARLGSGQPQLFPQHIQQQVRAPGGHAAHLAIHPQVDRVPSLVGYHLHSPQSVEHVDDHVLEHVYPKG